MLSLLDYFRDKRQAEARRKALAEKHAGEVWHDERWVKGRVENDILLWTGMAEQHNRNLYIEEPVTDSLGITRSGYHTSETYYRPLPRWRRWITIPIILALFVFWQGTAMTRDKVKDDLVTVTDSRDGHARREHSLLTLFWPGKTRSRAIAVELRASCLIDQGFTWNELRQYVVLNQDDAGLVFDGLRECDARVEESLYGR